MYFCTEYSYVITTASSFLTIWRIFGILLTSDESMRAFVEFSFYSICEHKNKSIRLKNDDALYTNVAFDYHTKSCSDVHHLHIWSSCMLL